MYSTEYCTNVFNLNKSHDIYDDKLKFKWQNFHSERRTEQKKKSYKKPLLKIIREDNADNKLQSKIRLWKEPLADSTSSLG